VPSESDSDVSYLVDMEVRHCSCPQGQLKGPCKHKQLVSVSKNVPSFDVIPSESPEMRKVFMYLGTGRSMSLDWFLPMQANMAVAEDVIHVPSQVTSVDENSQQDEEVAENLNSSPVDLEPTVVHKKLDDVFNQLKSKFESRISEDPAGYDKALDAFQKTVLRLPTTSDSALQKCLHSFGKSVTQVTMFCTLVSQP
jgi:hypothetical protein